jgi:ATP/maltotriose-dependent transcriptional regulator MalT
MEPLARANDALKQYDWHGVHDAVLDTGWSPELEGTRLELLGEAAWWLGHLDACIDARERAYNTYEAGGERRRAGMCAVWLWENYSFKSRPAIASGWLRRARRALDDDRECEEYGALVLREAETAHGSGELETAATLARDMIALGRQLRSDNLEAEALQTLGRILIDHGQVNEGLACMDEAMLSAVEGRLGPFSTGKVYCSLIGACEQLGDLKRAAEWSDATARWAERHPHAVFPGVCRVHLASSLRERGEFAQAELQAKRALDELADISIVHASAAWAEVGEIRRRIGDLDGAEEAFHAAEELTGSPQPGLALLRLAQGRADAAAAIAKRALDETTWDRLGRARLLPAYIQIAIACGDLEAAATAVAELDAIASQLDGSVLDANAMTARGRLQLANDDAAARGTLRAAAELWRALEVPYEVGTARMLHGVACRRVGDDDGAQASFDAAESIFQHLGAESDIAALGRLSKRGTLPKGLTEREAEVLRLVAAGCTNKEIAAKLFLSEKTVSRHLSNIFTKIGVSSRSAATAFAYAEHIVKDG